MSKISLFAYFNKINFQGKEHLKSEEPVIVVANHPSTFMDPIILGSIMNFQLYFIAAAEYMGKGLKFKLMKSLFHMIPVYRPGKHPGKTGKNSEMFENCFHHLSQKKSLLIFPEGVSITADHLHPLKTGVARIALGAIEKHKELKIKILPIGLNYSNPHKFRSDLFIKVAEPISVELFYQPHKTEKENVNDLMKLIRERMEESLLHVEELENSDFLKQVLILLRYFNSADPETEIEKFETIKEVNQLYNLLKKKSPEEVEQLKNLTAELFINAEKNNIDLSLLHVKSELKLGQRVALMLGLPFFILGTMLNYIPYRLTGIIHDKLKPEQTFSGAISLAIGMMLFLLWYIGITVVACLLFSWCGLFIPIIAYSSGFFSLLYLRKFDFIQKVRRIRQVKENEIIWKSFHEQISEIHEVMYALQGKL